MIKMEKTKDFDFYVEFWVKDDDLKCEVTVADNWPEEFSKFMIDWFIQLWVWLLDRMKLSEETKKWVLARWSQKIAKEVLKD